MDQQKWTCPQCSRMISPDDTFVTPGSVMTVACVCGIVFERFVTPAEADADLIRLASLN